jgi:hypothetical protein
MSVQIAWQPSPDSFIASYDVERSISISGPWTLLANIAHDVGNLAVYDPALGQFFYVDSGGTPGYYYRLTSIDDQAVRSAPSAPFRPASEGQTPFSSVLVSEITIPAGNVDVLWSLGYRTIEVWKSTDFGNSFTEITSGGASSAHLHSSPPNTKYYLKSAVIAFLVDGAQTPDIVFAREDNYYSAAQVVAVINAVYPGLSFVGDAGEVVVTSSTVGRTSSIQLTKSVGAAQLGFSPERVVGADPRIDLVSGQPIYFFYDVDPAELHSHEDGLSTPKEAIRYKWRYSANGQLPFSNFSSSTFDNQTRLGIDPSELSVGVALFVSPNGRAQKKAVLVSASSTQKIGNVVLAPDVTLSVESDSSGFCQIPLIRGSKVTIAIEGTNIVREITVPDTSVFDLLDAIASAPDQFAVQSPVPLLTRRSL